MAESPTMSTNSVRSGVADAPGTSPSVAPTVTAPIVKADNNRGVLVQVPRSGRRGMNKGIAPTHDTEWRENHSVK
jgi:hypothetical protein